MLEAVISTSASSEGVDAHEEFRFEVIKEVAANLSQDDRHFVRYLLGQEIIAHGEAWSVSSSIVLCAGLLFELRHAEDALLIWKAKQVSFDTHCGIPVELLVGAGVDKTLGYWRTQTSSEAKDLYEFLKEAAYAGEFSGLDEFREEFKERMTDLRG